MVVAMLLQPSAAGAEGIPTELIQGFLVSDALATLRGI
jgi:hypothetical protein